MENPHQVSQDANYGIGLDCLCRLEATDRPSIIEALADVAPDLASLAISFVYGQIYPRPHLTLKERQLVTVAALAALGNARPQLKFHLAGALNAGATSTELVELMLHLVVYAGFPAGLNGVFAAREVFAERGIAHTPAQQDARAAAGSDARYQSGWDALRRIDGHVGEQIVASLADLAPDLGRFIVEFGFGDIYTRPGLGLLDRELATVALLAALGTAAPQLRVHIHGLLNVGGTREQLVEALIHTAAYAGFPAAINAMLVAKEVLAERGTAPTGSAPTSASPP
ncbi:carboxymuconolactone decarboxylase family protein [Sphaerotilus uruguayifluvii]|uniref:4-carboxymuconolactone decarboxylase n=1 Tax=Sphaerotilus uruguayifluvii TaxID=2735897 RepID=A0ABX2G9B2_9BURK|nr:carboxymuconolactone decarboxylase family protein [Leptothrix sp. C29]NRT58371.1 4-carboxymuconolactone decarboxylase [Leptothrix sp. C29]